MQAEEIKALAAAAGFDACYIVPADWAADSPPGCATLLLLLQGYQGELLPTREWAAIHPYYFASQQAYFQTQALVSQLKALGLVGRQAPELYLRPLCGRLKPFWQGRNFLLYHEGLGSRFHIQVIALEEALPWETSLWAETPASSPCGSCQRCLRACPVGAITREGVDASRCLRQHMLMGSGTPGSYREVMKNRLIGCDNCQAACPRNPPASAPQPISKIPLAALLPPEKPLVETLAQTIGRNLALPNRLCAQACIAAGNSRNSSLLPQLEALSNHPSRVVAAQAQWAAQRIRQALEGGV